MSSIKYYTLCTALILSGSALVQSASAMDLQVSADSFISQAQPTENFGSSDAIASIESDESAIKGYLRFDASGLTGPIDRVRGLHMTFARPHARAADFFLLTGKDANDWEELTLTWENAPGNNRHGTGFTGEAVFLGRAQGEAVGKPFILELDSRASAAVTQALNSGSRQATIVFQHVGTRQFNIFSREFEGGRAAASLRTTDGPPPTTSNGSLLPIRYQEGRGERELLGYNPRFEPNIVSFNPEGRPFIRTWPGNQRVMMETQTQLIDGSWQTFPGPQLPAGYSLGTFSRHHDTPIVFDSDGDAYTLIDGTGADNGAWFLAHSTDGCRTWTVYKTAFGPMPGRYQNLPPKNANRALIESPGKVLAHGHPPVIVGNDATHLLLIAPEKRPDGTLHLPEPVQLADVTGDAAIELRSPSHEGFGGFNHSHDRPVIATDEAVFIAYIRAVPVEGHPGTPTYIVHYDRHSSKVSEPVFLGHAGIEIDSHNRPQLAFDSHQRIHVILGAHGGRRGQHLIHRYSLQPAAIGEWSEPNALLTGLTYPSILIDPQDTLHLFARDHNGDFTYDRKPAGEAWEPRRQVVIPGVRLGYFLYYHSIQQNPSGDLYLSYLSVTRERGPWSPERRQDVHGPNLIRSRDGGLDWSLVEDFPLPQTNIHIPIRYQPNWHERELFDYHPEFEPALVSFSPENRPFIRRWFDPRQYSPDIQILDDNGEWQMRNPQDFLPEGVEAGYWTGMTDYMVSFDQDGDAYVLIASTLDPDSRWYLMHSRDQGETWTPYQLPFGPMVGDYLRRTVDGNRALMEQHVNQPGYLEHPPVIMGNDATHLKLVVPRKLADGTLEIPPPVRVVDVSGDLEVEFDVPWKAGWGGNGHGSQQKIVSHGDSIFFAWARPLRPDAHPGTPQFIAEFSRSQNALVGEPVHVGSNGIEVDSHNQPVIALDSRGYIHYLLGSHGTFENPHETVTYARSKRPLDISAFTGQMRLPAPGCTYPAIAIDSNDTLHVVTRKYDTYAWVTATTFEEGYTQARRNPGDHSQGFNHFGRSRVAYFRLPADGEWEYQPLVVTHFGGYVYWSNYVSIDNNDRVFVSYRYSPRAEQVRRPIPSTMLFSDDGGNRWHLTHTADF